MPDPFLPKRLLQSRDEQAKRVMPLIGPMLDAWEMMPNDEKGLLQETNPTLCKAINKINSAMENR